MFSSLIGRSTKQQVLLKSLDTYMARSRSISSNIANSTTAGYQRREVKFEESLGKALSGSKLRGARTSNGHMQLGAGSLANVQHEIVRPYDPTLPSGVNNVDIDREMADLAENQIAFKMAMQQLSGTYSKLNAAIQLKSIPGQ